MGITDGRSIRLLPALVAACALVLVLPRSAPASARTVVLLSPTDQEGTVTADSLTRIEGELRLAGFFAKRQVEALDDDPRAALDRALAEGETIAALAVIPRTPHAQILLAVQSPRTMIDHRVVLPADRHRQVALLALSAVELMRAALGELWPREPVQAEVVPSVRRSVISRPMPPIDPVGSRHFSVDGMTRLYVPEGLLIAGATVGLELPVSRISFVRAELGLGMGAAALPVGRVQALAADLGVFVGVTSAGAPLAVRGELGGRLGAVRLSADLDPRHGFGGRSGAGPWSGPAARASVYRDLGGRFALRLTVEAGWAILGTIGAIDEIGGARVSVAGPWAQAALGIAFEP